MGIDASMFILAYLFPVLLPLAKVALLMISIFFLLDIFILFKSKEGISASRKTPDKFSNGDQNPVYLFIENHYGFQVDLEIIDEVPIQFQLRDL